MPDLLLELLSEEIPARMQGRAASDLAELVARALKEVELEPARVEGFATPRRLALHASGLPDKQPDLEVDKRGPRVGAPDAALEGFKASLGVETYRLEEEDDKKGRVWVARYTRVGRPAAEVLGPVIGAILQRFPWPKSMRWGDQPQRWVRPLHGIVCLLDGAVVPVVFAKIAAGRTTRGHRFLAPGPIEVETFEDYRDKLRAASVILDPARRRDEIRDEASRLAREEGLRLRDDPALIDELAGLVEWPVALRGRIDRGFMTLPEEVLVTTMRQQQKYLALEDTDGRLAPQFVVIANLRPADGGAAIVRGNERVLRARLWDARFFWEQDQKRPLASRVPRLEGMVFHARLGNLRDKANRLEALVRWIGPSVPGCKLDHAARAALLCKADLISGMVGEFPELQGVIGRHYAEHDLEHIEVCEAIEAHYQPQGPGDRCPKAPVSVALALADKMDTLAGFFAIQEKPTGSKDPFALRRAALGMIRLILENRIRLPLRQTFAQAIDGYGDLLGDVDTKAVIDDLVGFIAERLKIHLKSSGVRHDLISAVFAAGQDDDLIRLLAKVEALTGFLATEDGANLLTAHRRASNIVKIEEKRDGRSYDGQPDGQRLQAAEEQMLFFRLVTVGGDIAAALEHEAFGDAMAALARLRSPIDAFFDHVTVNANDQTVRVNRLYLLSQIRSALGVVADFSLIEEAPAPQPDKRVA